VPKGTVIRTEEGLKEAVEKYGYPLVIKPLMAIMEKEIQLISIAGKWL
jgi:formate-dependent phosphoribosylglycinamide formyltransferase (GAR transformylase)